MTLMNECIFMPLIVFISLRPPDIHYRDNNLISNITRLGKVLREAIVLGVLPNRPPFTSQPNELINSSLLDPNVN